MTKNQMIKRLKELSLLLGRELNTTGTDEELALRLQEAEVEAEALNDDTITGDGNTGTQNDGADSDAVINGPNQDPLTAADTTPGEDVEQTVVADTIVVKYVLVRMLTTVAMPALEELTDVPVSLLLKGGSYRVRPEESALLRKAGLIEEV